ncbi:hypothetical protein CP967_11155 [Streptomyces nitrosporeus]|uniref:Uncharacterized protein n=1 Tax=Streptomyces nitrosporeus TaxID=28894 RepID=A0A5J6F8Y4_9ACTN|nr:hypothetical protein CP967_11155 [Streptomyces nitrosporeus]GGY77600.1 hypothetical protein GCM10010327_04680 [Streptomyces nitrosporeus]
MRGPRPLLPGRYDEGDPGEGGLCRAASGGAAVLPGLLAKRFFGAPPPVAERRVPARAHRPAGPGGAFCAPVRARALGLLTVGQHLAAFAPICPDPVAKTPARRAGEAGPGGCAGGPRPSAPPPGAHLPGQPPPARPVASGAPEEPGRTFGARPEGVCAGARGAGGGHA